MGWGPAVAHPGQKSAADLSFLITGEMAAIARLKDYHPGGQSCHKAGT